MDYIPSSDLKKHIDKQNPFSEQQALKFLKEIFYFTFGDFYFMPNRKQLLKARIK